MNERSTIFLDVSGDLSARARRVCSRLMKSTISVWALDQRTFTVAAALFALVAVGTGTARADSAAVTFGIAGDAATLDSSVLPSSVLDSDVIPLADADILVSAVDLSGASNNTTSTDTSSAGGVSVVIIVMSVLGGLALAIVTGLVVYHVIKSRNIASGTTVVDNHHGQPDPGMPHHPNHRGGFVLPGPMTPHGHLSICLHPGDVQGGYYNRILQMDLSNPAGMK